MDDETVSPFWGSVFWVFVLCNVVFYCYLGYDKAVNVPKREAARQLQIDTFYQNNNCHPEGYIPTKYEPVRTYRCDNGLFIVRDMK